MICAIILAAGASTRMGRCKQLIKLGGKPLIKHVVEAALKSRVDKVLVVLGFKAEEVRRVVGRHQKLEVVYNRDYELGLSSSIKAGLRSLPKSCEAALFMLGDQPFVKPSTINKLIEAYRRHGKELVVPTHHGVRGNPVLIGRKFFSRLEKLTGDIGGRVLLGEEDFLRVEVDDEGILIDLDSLKDLREAEERLKV